MLIAGLPCVRGGAVSVAYGTSVLRRSTKPEETTLTIMKAMLAACLLCLTSAATARAETDQLRIGVQYGLPYMQLVIMQDHDFLTPRAREAGLPTLRPIFVTMGGPAAINDGVISGAIDVGAVGVSNLVTMWSKTAGKINIRGLAGMNIMPLLLVTRDPRIITIADYRPGDRIAVPSIKVSMQAMMLDVLAAKNFGEAEFGRLDGNTISMSHPDATAALLAGSHDMQSHFSSLPYQHIELQQQGAHVVASSYDAIGPHSVSALAATTRFRSENPKVVAAFLAALQDATDFINQRPREAAQAYLRINKDHVTPDELVAMMHDPGVEFTLRPQGAEATAAFMAKVGLIKVAPKTWQDMYFDTVPTDSGS
jgi:NitT/TauT family transport system substrate-binding protein